MAETKGGELTRVEPGFHRNGMVGVTEVDPADVMSGMKGLAASLTALDKAKPTDMEELEKDFWKPSAKGEKKRGIYLGWSRALKADGTPKKLLVHALAVLDAKGKPMPLRINGTAVLTRQLKRIKEGTPIEIEFNGEDKTTDGDKVNLYTVRLLKGHETA